MSNFDSFPGISQLPAPAHGDFWKTFLLHLLLVAALCLYVQGGFLLLYPPALIFWIFFCLLLSIYHNAVHAAVQRFWSGRHLITSLWLFPLLQMNLFIIGAFACFFLADQFSASDIFRNLLQMPLAPFSRVVFVYFLQSIGSATYLFAELSILWMPHLQKRHFHRGNRKASHLAILALFMILFSGIIYIGWYRPAHLVYLSALVSEKYGSDFNKSIELFHSIKKERRKLRCTGLYRVARITQLRLHRYKKARKLYGQLLETCDPSLKGDCLYQRIKCGIALKSGFNDLQKDLGALESTNSCLIDDAWFEVGLYCLRSGRRNEAHACFEKLSQVSWFRFVVMENEFATEFRFRHTQTAAHEYREKLHTEKLLGQEII